MGKRYAIFTLHGRDIGCSALKLKDGMRMGLLHLDCVQRLRDLNKEGKQVNGYKIVEQTESALSGCATMGTIYRSVGNIS